MSRRADAETVRARVLGVATAYRVSLLFDVLLSAPTLTAAVTAVEIGYSRTGSLAGWSKPEMLVLVGAFPADDGSPRVVPTGAWEFARYPTDMCRRPMRFVLTYAFPMALVAALPSAPLTRRPGGNGLPATAAGGPGAVLFAVGVWSRGARRHTAATS